MNIHATTTLGATVRVFSIAIALSASVQAKHITIVPDISRSNPLFEDVALNGTAASYIKGKIETIKIGDVVSVRFIGSLTDTQSLQKMTHTITHHNKGMVKSMMPQLVQGVMKEIQPASNTNIIAFFNRNTFGCQDGGEVIVLTDGIEASEYVSPAKLLSGDTELPKPSEYVHLKGCTVTFYGIGAKRSDTELNRLRKQWQRYFDAVGASFRAITL